MPRRKVPKPRRHRTVVTPELMVEVAGLVRAGMPLREVAAAKTMSVSTVRSILQRLDVAPLTAEERAHLRRSEEDKRARELLREVSG